MRKDIPVLKKLNLTVNAGQKVALVGTSGCGKSTIYSLLERFYQAEEGSIVSTMLFRIYVGFYSLK